MHIRLICLLVLLITYSSAHAKVLYVSAGLANVREQAIANAKLITQVNINKPFDLVSKNGAWCEISSTDKIINGFILCQNLSDNPITLEQIESETAKEVLAINRLVSSLKRDSMGTNKYDELAHIKLLFNQLERHFYYSPSVNTYQLYQDLIRYTKNRFNEGENKPLPNEILRLINTNAAQLPAMRSALNFTPEKQYPALTRPITYTLTALLKKRQHYITPDKIQPSFFSKGAWAFGWEGNAIYDIQVEKSGQGVAYKIGFDAYNVSSLGAALEMAKHFQLPVKMTFQYKKNTEGSGLEGMTQSHDGKYEFGEVTTELPAYAITEKGIVKGKFVSASFAGDACWGDSNTYAKFIFPKMLESAVHGVFVSSVPINAHLAKVSLRKKTHHSYDTLAHTVRLEVDIDDDGVMDLRTVSSVHAEVSSILSPYFAQNIFAPKLEFKKVAGWYANDVFSLEANQDGLWQTLSIYNISTCT